MSTYIINGVEYPSVTTIIGLLDKGDAISQWAVNCAIRYLLNKALERFDKETFIQMLEEAKVKWKEARETAKDIGSEVHDLIHKYIKYGRDACGEIRDEVANGFLAFLEWEKQNQIEWIESEKPVVNEEHGYAGTLDAICRIKGVIYCIDFKSSGGFYDGYDMQISAYAEAREKMGGEYAILREDGSSYIETYQPVRIRGIGVVRLDKETGMPEWKDYTERRYIALQSFKHLLKFYYKYKNRRLKHNPFVRENAR